MIATVVGDLPITCTWDFGDAGTLGGTDTNSIFTYAAIGVYTVTLEVTNVCPSTDRESISVTVNEVGPVTYRVYLPLVLKN